MKTFLPAVTAALLCLAATAAAEKDIITQSFSVKPGGKLYMNVDRGSIHIQPGDSDHVEVKVVRELKRASDARAKEVYAMHKIDFSQSGDAVRIEAQNQQSFGRFRNPFNNLQVEYEIAVPSRYDIDVRTSGGGIQMGDLQGDIKARTSGGDVRLGTIDGPVQAQTSGGTIALKGGKGPADLHTSGGDLRVGQLDGDLIARTSGGSITLESVKGSTDAQTSGGNIRVNEAYGPVSARTSGGNVSARLSRQPKGNCALKTSGGNVSVSLADNLAIDVTAHTSGGSVHSDFPGELNKQRTKLVAQINGGGPDLVLETSGGDVEIRRK